MRLTRATLIDKALGALDEAIEAAGSGPVQPTLALRFALTFLYACSDGDRHWFETFLRTIQDEAAGSTLYMANYSRPTHARTARTAIARSVGAAA